MTLRNSFLVRSKENNKRRIWVWIVSILFQLVCYPGIMTVYISRIKFRNTEGSYATAALYKKELYQAVADAVGFQPKSIYMIALLAVLIGMQGFAYLNDKKKVDMYYSVPIPAKSRFRVIYVNGILIYLIPYLFSILISFVMAAAQGAVGKTAVAECGLAVLMNIIFFLVIYHITILVMMITGNQIVAGFGILGLLCLDIIWVDLVNSMKYTFFKTADSFFTYYEAKLSVLSDYSAKIYSLKIEEKLLEIVKQILPFYGKWAVIALLFGVLSYLCYKKRPAEAAGKAIAYGKLKPCIKVITAVTVGIAACLIIYDAVYYNAALTALGALIGTVLCCAVIEVVFEFDLRAAIRHLLSTGIALVIVLAVFCIYHFDVFGYDTYIPGAEKVESAAVLLDYSQSHFEMTDEESHYISNDKYCKQNMFLSDIDAICELARKSQDTDSENMTEPREIRVLYRLRSGREVSRCFMIDFADVSNEELLNRIIGTEEYRRGHYQIVLDASLLESKNLEVAYTNGTVEKALPSAEAGELREAWLKDMEKFDFSLARNNRPCGMLQFYFKGYYTSWTLPVYDTFSNTIAFLEARNAYYPVLLNAEDIASIEITNWHYELEEQNEQGMPTDSVAREQKAVADYEDSFAVTKTFSEPEEIAEIIQGIYPFEISLYWNSQDEIESDYNITIAFKTNTDYPYGMGYYSYAFVKGQVPDFVVEETAYLYQK